MLFVCVLSSHLDPTRRDSIDCSHVRSSFFSLPASHLVDFLVVFRAGCLFRMFSFSAVRLFSLFISTHRAILMHCSGSLFVRRAARQAADAAKKKFAVQEGDHLTLLNGIHFLSGISDCFIMSSLSIILALPRSIITIIIIIIIIIIFFFFFFFFFLLLLLLLLLLLNQSIIHFWQTERMRLGAMPTSFTFVRFKVCLLSFPSFVLLSLLHSFCCSCSSCWLSSSCSSCSPTARRRRR